MIRYRGWSVVPAISMVVVMLAAYFVLSMSLLIAVYSDKLAFVSGSGGPLETALLNAVALLAIAASITLLTAWLHTLVPVTSLRHSLSITAPMLSGALISAVAIASSTGSFWFSISVAALLSGACMSASAALFLLQHTPPEKV